MILPFVDDDFNNLSFKASFNIDLNDETLLRNEILKQWLSLFDIEAINYRKQNQIRTYHSQMAVLV
jgi:phosphoenolpyruvate synthase/pyruvate phosphate dikinase